MVRRTLLPLVLAAELLGQTKAPTEASLRTFERKLSDVIHWELLWNSTPKYFKTPTNGLARLAISWTPTTLSYCSHDIAVCATYLIAEPRNWQRLKSARCAAQETDEESLLSFVGTSPRARSQSKSQAPRVGLGGLLGVWAPDYPIRWTATVTLEPRSAIVRRYKQLHPPEAESLRSWLRANLRDSGYDSVTVACFKSSDPEIYIYGERVSEVPIVFSVFWDRNREEWVDSGMLERPQGPETFDELKATIQAIACDTITFR